MSPPPPCTQPSENRLLDELRGGDHAAFQDLVSTHHGNLLRCARRFVASHAVAEEVVQDTWVAVLQGLSRFEGRSSLKTWIYCILHNRARSTGVRESRSLPFVTLLRGDTTAGLDPDDLRSDFEWVMQSKPSPSADPEQAALDRETENLVLHHLRELPAKQGTVVYLRDFKHWTSTEVCEALDISPVYQRVLLHRGRSRIREALTQPPPSPPNQRTPYPTPREARQATP